MHNDASNGRPSAFHVFSRSDWHSTAKQQTCSTHPRQPRLLRAQSASSCSIPTQSTCSRTASAHRRRWPSSWRRSASDRAARILQPTPPNKHTKRGTGIYQRAGTQRNAQYDTHWIAALLPHSEIKGPSPHPRKLVHLVAIDDLHHDSAIRHRPVQLGLAPGLGLRLLPDHTSRTTGAPTHDLREIMSASLLAMICCERACNEH